MQFVTEKQAKKFKDGYVLDMEDLNDKGPMKIPDTVDLKKRIIEALQFMTEPDMLKLKKTNEESYKQKLTEFKDNFKTTYESQHGVPQSVNQKHEYDKDFKEKSQAFLTSDEMANLKNEYTKKVNEKFPTFPSKSLLKLMISGADLKYITAMIAQFESAARGEVNIEDAYFNFDEAVARDLVFPKLDHTKRQKMEKMILERKMKGSST